jgi:GNAT superfamily N-acetyltransferase
MLNDQPGAERVARSPAGLVIHVSTSPSEVAFLCDVTDRDAFAEHCQVPVPEPLNTTYVTAWLSDLPVGHLYVKWDGSTDHEVRSRIPPRTPELSNVSVWPPTWRSSGIGRALVHAAEAVVKARGFEQVGMGVEVTNERARRLYERLGYRDWGSGVYHDQWAEAAEDGTEVFHVDPCTYLVKKLSRP